MKHIAFLLAFLISTAAQAGLITKFDPAAVQTPESVAVGLYNEYYVSMGLTGQIVAVYKDGDSYVQETHAQLPIDPTVPCGVYGEIMGALAIDISNTLYVTVNSCTSEYRGVWKVPPRNQGDPPSVPELVTNVPLEALVNGITKKFNNLYFADSALGLVWEAPADGGEATVWLDDPLLKQDPPGGMIPGPNGLQYFFALHRVEPGYLGEFYVANSSTADIIRVPILFSWSGPVAGEPVVHVTLIYDNTPMGADDFALSLSGNIYAGTDFYNVVLRATQSGEVTAFACGEGWEGAPCYCGSCMDGVSSVAFGRWFDYKKIVITNAAFPFFSPEPDPSLWMLDAGEPGFPR